MGITLRLGVRMVFVVILLGAVYSGVYIAFERIFPGSSVTAAGIVFGLIGVQILFSSFFFRWSVQSEPVSEDSELQFALEEVAESAGVPKPNLRIVDTPTPNAFATGLTQRTATITVTTGLVSVLDFNELQSVLAHEVAHIANRDVVIMTIASVPVVISSKLYSMAQSVPPARRSIAVSIVIPLSYLCLGFTLGVASSLSRYREYIADYDAVQYTGTPKAFASALQKVTNGVSQTTGTHNLDTLSIVPTGTTALSVFDTHPSTSDRIERIVALYDD